MSAPPSKIEPELGAIRPEIRLNSVVLPAPFGPMTACTPPGSTVSLDRVHRDQTGKPSREPFQP